MSGHCKTQHCYMLEFLMTMLKNSNNISCMYFVTCLILASDTIDMIFPRIVLMKFPFKINLFK